MKTTPTPDVEDDVDDHCAAPTMDTATKDMTMKGRPRQGTWTSKTRENKSFFGS